MLKDIIEVKPTGEYRLWLRFEDGVQGEVDLRPILSGALGVLVAWWFI